MVGRNKQIIPIKFPFLHVVLSHFIVMFCTICFFEDEQFISTGKLYSPITLILAAGELLRWGISKYSFGLDVSIKEYSISSTRLTAAKNLSTVAHIKNYCKLCALLMTFVVVFIVTCILMGAPYYQNYEETLALSILLTSLTILPIGLFLGPSKTIQYLFYDSFELNSTFDIWQLELLQYNAFGTLVGAWAGSVVAPLDWDRPWQAYPIPNIVGAVLGFSFANIHTFLSSIIQISDRMIDMSIISNEKKAI
ncbi:phosphatidylinositol-glycan biosynthesis class F protein [Contarinia nasturtii]|uniref:phosphatidylinositol-glycan biosynthesis class F protein n=1 Tax=Contarinia nasturtii TaxID=265458 RepID=UPI0012D4AE0F|nr:phosphatidylinositol-glycan biosynthesis class F protein [Contarinia nasturtii]